MSEHNKSMDLDDVSGDQPLQVVPVTEIKATLDGIKTDHAALIRQIQDDKAATQLELEKRGDDMDKYIKAVDDLSTRMDSLNKSVQSNAFAGTFGQSAGELKDALDSFRAGFHQFNGDKDAAEVLPGTAPSLKHLVEGVFQDADDDGVASFHAPRHVAIRRLQKAADRAYQVDAALRSTMDPGTLQEYLRAGGVKSLKTWKRFEAMAETFSKAAGDLIDTSTEVTNWVPTQYSANLYELVRLALPELTLFPEVAMSAPTVVLPLNMNDKEAMLIGEVTSATNADPYADTDFLNPSAISSNKITLEAVKLRSRFWVSEEASEDTIVMLLPFLNREHPRAIGEAIADAIINGQPTNLDTGGTHFGKTNPLVVAGTDARDAWDGIRRFAAQYATTPAVRADNSNGKPTVTGFRALRAAMKEYGTMPQDLAMLLSTVGYIKLLDDSNVLTVDKFGPQATVRTGSLAQVDGVDVMVSRRIATNMNASGIIDGTTTNRTQAFLVHTGAAILGNRRRITLAEQRHVSSDTRELVAFWRGDFQPVYPVASVPAFCEMYNVAAA